eukprot:6214249-Pleurochrysis_carterae.AAC.1
MSVTGKAKASDWSIYSNTPAPDDYFAADLLDQMEEMLRSEGFAKLLIKHLLTPTFSVRVKDLQQLKASTVSDAMSKAGLDPYYYLGGLARLVFPEGKSFAVSTSFGDGKQAAEEQNNGKVKPRNGYQRKSIDADYLGKDPTEQVGGMHAM